MGHGLATPLRSSQGVVLYFIGRSLKCRMPLVLSIISSPRWFVRAQFWLLEHPGHTPIMRRQWHPTPVLLPGKSHGWRSLVGRSPWGHKESDTTERLTLSLSTFWGFSGGSDGKQSAYNTGDLVRSPGSGRSAGEGKGYHSNIFFLICF